ncbi:MAG: phosphoenolpyruvate--protein phosphotransferase [Gammaproteobacteria bacterium]|nr:phosphoenolpyruvate--protein phosphotransferase [Gammaproteobacteria bacterium]MDH5800787.1 phosphoenolpyruvate--protein phosphotransferase [Gammaproteobacteria bacterium]
MLDTLRRIVQDVNNARDLQQALDIIVNRVKKAMGVDLCSVYLTDHVHKHYVLMATNGLNPDAVGDVRLEFGEGLTGLVAAKEEVLNIADAAGHPNFKYVPQSGEEVFHAYLGVPIIHHRKLLGVLVLQRHQRQKFDEDIVTFLITIAAQLAGAIAHAEASGGIDGLQKGSLRSVEPYQGHPGAQGVGVGDAFVLYSSAELSAVPDRKIDNVEDEIQVFQTALQGVREDIGELLSSLVGILPAEDRALFDAYLLMLDSDTLINGVEQRIREGNWASGALRDTIKEHIQVFDEMEDPYLRERSTDIRDLGRRILTRLQSGGSRRPLNLPDRTVLVGEEITASMLAEIPVDHITGVVSVAGSRTSHVAILARAMGIPAVMGVDLPVSRIDGKRVVVDGYSGQVYVEPTRAICDEFQRLAQEEKELSADLAALQELPSVTPDGVHVPLHVNSGLLADIVPTEFVGAEGIGLYRTEFPFMVRDRFPGEEEQYLIYRELLKSFEMGPVTIRTLDVGGDKALPYFPITEDNPFLGWRGIRISLDHPEIFLVQLRAMLRANESLDNMQLLLPMVNSVGEVDDALALLKRAFEELRETNAGINMPKVGVMIEVPSAVYQVESIARRVDFLSVGTNDLTQYLLAVDRNNSRVAELYDSLHPAVLQALVQIVKGSHREHKPVSICGEMAGDPAAAILLVGMGYDSLSMSVANLPRIKWVIRNFTTSRARRLLSEVLEFEHAYQVRNHLNGILESSGLGGLVRPGR